VGEQCRRHLDAERRGGIAWGEQAGCMSAPFGPYIVLGKLVRETKRHYFYIIRDNRHAFIPKRSPAPKHCACCSGDSSPRVVCGQLSHRARPALAFGIAQEPGQSPADDH